MKGTGKKEENGTTDFCTLLGRSSMAPGQGNTIKGEEPFRSRSFGLLQHGDPCSTILCMTLLSLELSRESSRGTSPYMVSRHKRF